MRKAFLLAVSSLVFGSFVMADTFNGPTNLTLKTFDSLDINGPAKLKLIKAKSLDVKGTLDFHSLDIADKAVVNGPVSGEKGKFGKLEVTGPFVVDHVISDDLYVTGPVKATFLEVKSDAEFIGPVFVQHAKFHDLVATAEKITLEDVTVQDLTVEKTDQDQVLVLKGNTVVNGDIEFASGKGIVQADSTVEIKGKVKGGTVEKN